MRNGCDLFSIAIPGVRGLSPYQPGKPVSELQRELGLSHIVKLASNENPLGTSPSVQATIEQAIVDITRYPDGNGFALKNALSKKLGVHSAQITLGNGSNDVLEMIARAFVAVEHEVIYSQYAFAVYPLVVQAIGAVAKVSQSGEGIAWPQYGHDLEAMLALISEKTKLVFIANPNNPTGSLLSHADLQQFLLAVPNHVIVVLDEAYFEYAADDASADSVLWLEQFPNLIITRTFSKAYGLAGLRVGYAIAHADVTNVLNRVRQPFNTNSLAQVAALAALADETYLQDSVAANKKSLIQISAGLIALGLQVLPTAGNFLLVEFARPALPIFQALLQAGVIVRPVDNYGLPNHLRISMGTEVENSFFLAALAKVLNHD